MDKIHSILSWYKPLSFPKTQIRNVLNRLMELLTHLCLFNVPQGLTELSGENIPYGFL